MKKLLSLFLAIIFVFSFASCSETEACERHIDTDGNMYCDFCLAIFICSHADVQGDGACDLCACPYVCPGHQDANVDGICDRCQAEYTCPGHLDENSDGKCEVCNAEFACIHKDADGDGKCDSCLSYFTCPSHQDLNSDGVCDFCAYAYVCVEHKDADGNAFCDICDAPYSCIGHIDANGDGRCDECGAFGNALDKVNPESVGAFVRYYQNSTPTRVHSETVRTVGTGSDSYTLQSTADLWVGTIAKNAASIYEESYVELRNVEDAAGEIVESVFKRTTYKKEFLQGNGVRETVDGKKGSWSSKGVNFAPTKGSIAIDIREDLVKDVTFTSAENMYTMEFSVSKANVRTVFGMNGATPNVDATGDVKVVLTSDGATITSIVMQYTVAAAGSIPEQTVKIVTEYEYSVQNITIE